MGSAKGNSIRTRKEKEIYFSEFGGHNSVPEKLRVKTC